MVLAQNAMIIAMIVDMTDRMEKQDFLKRLSFLTNKRKGNEPFSLNELFNDVSLVKNFKARLTP